MLNLLKYLFMPPKSPGIFRREFIRNTATLISGYTFTQIIAVLIYFILSRIYTPADFGLFGLYMSIVSITGIISTGKYEMAIMLPKKDEDAVNLLGLIVTLTVLFSLILLLPVVLLNRLISIMLGNEEISVWLYFIPLSTLLVGLFQGLKVYSNRLKEYRIITAANVGQSLTNSAGKLVIGPVFPGPAGLVVGSVLGEFTGTAIFTGRYLKKIKTSLGLIKWKRIKVLSKEYILFPKFNMLQSVINNFSGSLPIFIFSSYFTSAITGLFTMGYTIIYRPVNMVATAFYQVMAQRIIEKYNQGDRIYPDIKRFLYGLLKLITLPFLLVALFAPFIFRIALGSDWEEAGKYTQIIIPWFFTTCLAMPLSFIPDMFRQQKKAMILDLVKFILRGISMVIGVLKNDVYLGLMLFSSVSTLMIMYSLLWYISIIRKSEREKIKPEGENLEMGERVLE
jgi:O-antigen/teichoic acid export membrane protein